MRGLFLRSWGFRGGSRGRGFVDGIGGAVGDGLLNFGSMGNAVLFAWHRGISSSGIGSLQTEYFSLA